MDQGCTRYLANGRGVGHERVGDALDHLLDGTLTQRDTTRRCTQVLYRAAARPDDACQLTYEARQPWTIASTLGRRDNGFAQLAT